MKRLIVLIGLIAVVAALLFGAERIIGSILDRELAPLLTRQLGLPVQLEPIEADVLSLSARSARLVMGDPRNAAVEAVDVRVSLSWSGLLTGNIRLLHARAADLSLRLSNWPRSGKPWPQDYNFLEPWLPQTLRLQAGRYLSAQGEAWPVRELEWRRHSDKGASLAWLEDRGPGEVRFAAELASLPNLLALKDFDLDVEITAANTVADGAVLEVAVKPGATGGYSLLARAELATAQELRLAATGAVPWKFPGDSDIYISQLRPEVAAALLKTFLEEPGERNFAASLLTALPRLDLPRHRGRIEIAEIRLDDEAVVDTIINFSTGARGIILDSLTSQGPSAMLEGTGYIEAAGDSWRLQLAAALNASKSSKSIAARLVDANWHWSSGSIGLQGEGRTRGELLNSLQGEFLLQGWHRGKKETPFNVQGRLGKEPAALTLDELKIELGESVISGSLAFSGGRERRLVLRLDSRQLDLRFLFDGADAAPFSGVTLPEYLGWLPGVEIDSVLTLSNLQMQSVILARADITLDRTPAGGKLVVSATGVSGGEIDLRLEFENRPKLPTDVTISVDLAAVDLPRLFGEDTGLFDSRTAGSMVFSSQGDGVAEIFGFMRGSADLRVDFRRDADWKRPPRPEEQLRFSGVSSLVIEGDWIKGLLIRELDVHTVEQDLAGEISMVVGRQPWLIANFESDKIDVAQLLAWVPESAEDADKVDLLKSLRDFGQVRVSFAAGTVKVLEEPLQEVVLVISSAVDRFTLERLDFTFADSRLEGRAALDWEGELAQFHASGSVTDLVLDDFIYPDSQQPGVPLSGLIELASQGTRFAELASRLSAQLMLQAQPDSAEQSSGRRRQLQVDLQQLQQGVQADIKSLLWDNSELRGRVFYQTTSPPLLDIEISGGILDLEPWEGIDEDAAVAAATDEGGTLYSRTARTTSRFLGNLLTAPTQLLSGGAEDAPEGRYFSDQSLDTTFLTAYQAHIKGQLAEVISREGTARDLDFDLKLADGKLNLNTRAGFLNGGSADLQLNYDTAPDLPTAALTASFRDVYPTPQQLSFPHAGFVSLSSRGASPAELAAHLSGMSYVELGRGPIDFGAVSLLSADVATGVFRALLPGAAKKEPELRCAVVLAKFTDGLGITPYGYAARTDTANLMGGIEVDLREQELLMRFQSRSREGVGITLGNAFSNTVSIKGPLSKPAIVPNTTGILWRGWAAYMTLGMSVLGESLFNRALASANPCDDIRDIIRKDLCDGEAPAAASPLVCPP